MTSDDYRELASQYELAAERADEDYVRERLQSLAQSYLLLAKSTSVVERSTKVVDRIEARRKTRAGNPFAH